MGSGKQCFCQIVNDSRIPIIFSEYQRTGSSLMIIFNLPLGDSFALAKSNNPTRIKITAKKKAIVSTIVVVISIKFQCP